MQTNRPAERKTEGASSDVIDWLIDVRLIEPSSVTVGEAEVQIRVTDMNDNVPYFKDRIYTARVPENTDAGTVVISVTAEDKDEGITFWFVALYTTAK